MHPITVVELAAARQAELLRYAEHARTARMARRGR